MATSILVSTTFSLFFFLLVAGGEQGQKPKPNVLKLNPSDPITLPPKMDNKGRKTDFISIISTSTNVKRVRSSSTSSLEDDFYLQPPMSLASSSSSSSSSTRVRGPYFESNKTSFHITTRAGQSVMFDCVVILLQGRTVSWLRRRKDNLDLLTVGNTSFSDSRIGLRYRYPSNWRIGIDSVQKGDEGEYQCQLSTHPPKALIYHLKVIAPAVQILDENGHIVTERHYKVDSSLHLTCKATHVDKSSELGITWLKGDRLLPGGDNRIKVKMSKGTSPTEGTGFLSILSMRRGDSGNYTCRASSLASSTIAVHVLNAELPAAVQHENKAGIIQIQISFSLLVLIISFLHTRFIILHNL